MEFVRILDLRTLLAKKSFFVFGPRTTGKSYLVSKQLSDVVAVLDLLRGDVFLRLSANPADLEHLIEPRLAGRKRWVVIDEIQRLPDLLNEVHRLIEQRRLRFLLTGSSARKLRRGAVNLLAGRAWTAQLLPLTSQEIPNFGLDRFLRYGGLPPVVQSDEPGEELYAYVHTYLHEEIQAEGLVRRLPQFSRFLTTAALANGQLLNFAALASDTAIPASTIREYYSILQDTLIGFLLEPWTRSNKRKAISTAKFYFFDTGVVHALAGTQTLDRNSDLYGRSFEHWVGMELRAFLSYRRIRQPLRFWRSTHGHEVDFLVGERTAIETKATRHLSARDLRGLEALQQERQFKQLWMVSQDAVETTRAGIRCVHWRTFLDMLWNDKLISS